MAEQYSVLIADDSAFARRLVKRYLDGTEFRIVAEATNGIEAVAQYKAHSPDLVVLDVIMPEASGTDVLTSIMGLDPNAAVLMLSSLGTEDTVSQCLTTGAKTFIQKPFEKDALLGALRRLLVKKDVAGDSP